jgi:hypothetical protein
LGVHKPSLLTSKSWRDPATGFHKHLFRHPLKLAKMTTVCVKKCFQQVYPNSQSINPLLMVHWIFAQQCESVSRYDPVHWGVPEGSYATDPNGPTRTTEFRTMVQVSNFMAMLIPPALQSWRKMYVYPGISRFTRHTKCCKPVVGYATII